MPPLKLITSQVWNSVSAFLRRAGTIILVASMILWGLLTFPRSEPPPDTPPAEAKVWAVSHSAAGQLGKALEPVIAPLGFD